MATRDRHTPLRIAVVGSGGGATAAALKAAELGASVTVIELAPPAVDTDLGGPGLSGDRSAGGRVRRRERLTISLRNGGHNAVRRGGRGGWEGRGQGERSPACPLHIPA